MQRRTIVARVSTDPSNKSKLESVARVLREVQGRARATKFCGMICPKKQRGDDIGRQEHSMLQQLRLSLSGAREQNYLTEAPLYNVRLNLSLSMR